MTLYTNVNEAMKQLKKDEQLLCAPFMKGLALYNYASSCKYSEKETFERLFTTLTRLISELNGVKISDKDAARFERLTNAKYALLETLLIAQADTFDLFRSF